jgi:phosphoserine phosphatase
LNIPHVICSELEAGADGCLTGALRGGNCYGLEKLRRIDDFRIRHDVNWADVVIYSDHRSDLALLIQAGRGFVVNPSRAFARECRRHGLPVLRWR